MSKRKGIKGERELIAFFWEIGWAALRVAGSGSMHFPSPDLLVGNKIRVLALECKISKKDKKYLPKEEIKQLYNFSSYFGAEPWIAVRFSRKAWRFYNPEDLEETNKNFVVAMDAHSYLSLEQLTGQFTGLGE